MQIVTASFFTYSGPGRVSIARSCPRRTPKGFRGMRALAPGPWFHSVSTAEYLKRYRAQLAALDPQETIDRLSELVEGDRAVLLCWEVNPGDRWEVKPADYRPNCHRRIVAEWLAEATGQAVPELPAVLARDMLSGSECYLDPETPTVPFTAVQELSRGYPEPELQATGTVTSALGESQGGPILVFALERTSGVWWPTEVPRQSPAEGA